MKGAAWLGSASIVKLSLKVLSVAVLARLVSPEDYGVATGALVVVEFALMLGNLGLAPALVQREDLQDRHIATAFALALIVVGFLVAGMWFASPAFAALLRLEELTDVTRLLTLMVAFRLFGALCEALLARHMEMRRIAMTSLASWTLSTFAIAIPLAYAGLGYWALVLMYLFDGLLTAALLGYHARSHIPRPRLDWQSLRELTPLSLGFAVIAPLNFLNSNIDRFLLARLLGPADLGTYSRATFLAKTASTTFNGVARTAAFPAMSRVQSEPGRLRTAAQQGLALTALLAIPIGVFCAIFADELVDVLLGPQWQAATVPFAIFGAALYPILGQRFLSAIYQAVGRPYALLPIHLFNVLALFAAIALLAPYGLTAVCLGIATTMAVRFVMVARTACRFAGVADRELTSIHVAPITVGCGVLLVGLPVKVWLDDASSIVSLLAAVLLISLPAIVALRLLPSMVLGRAGLATANRVFGDRLQIFGSSLDLTSKPTGKP